MMPGEKVLGEESEQVRERAGTKGKSEPGEPCSAMQQGLPGTGRHIHQCFAALVPPELEGENSASIPALLIKYGRQCQVCDSQR